MERLALFTRRVNRVFLTLAGWLALALLAALSYDLVARNVFGAPTLWALDVSRFLLLVLFFFALAPTLQAGSHVSVDVLQHYLPAGPRRVMRILAQVLLLVYGAFLMWQICRHTYDAFIDDALFPTVVPIKLKHVYWVGPLGVLQFMLTGIVMLAEDLRWKG
jgi:TRAP-type C4-dicarboxylate transport system permease small subunit